jgi:hypothetical protein
MVLQHVALRFVQPRDHNEFVTHFHSEESVSESRFNLEPRVRRPFRSLPRRIFPALHRRSNEPDRIERIRSHPATFFNPSKTQLSASRCALFSLPRLDLDRSILFYGETDNTSYGDLFQPSARHAMIYVTHVYQPDAIEWKPSINTDKSWRLATHHGGDSYHGQVSRLGAIVLPFLQRAFRNA